MADQPVHPADQCGFCMHLLTAHEIWNLLLTVAEKGQLTDATARILVEARQLLVAVSPDFGAAELRPIPPTGEQAPATQQEPTMALSESDAVEIKRAVLAAASSFPNTSLGTIEPEPLAAALISAFRLIDEAQALSKAG